MKCMSPPQRARQQNRKSAVCLFVITPNSKEAPVAESDLPQCTNQDNKEVLSRRRLLGQGSAVVGTSLLAIAGMSGRPATAQGWPWSPWGYPVWKSTAWYRNYPNGPQ